MRRCLAEVTLEVDRRLYLRRRRERAQKENGEEKEIFRFHGHPLHCFAMEMVRVAPGALRISTSRLLSERSCTGMLSVRALFFRSFALTTTVPLSRTSPLVTWLSPLLSPFTRRSTACRIVSGAAKLECVVVGKPGRRK